MTVRLRLKCLSRGAYHLSDLQVVSSFPTGLVLLGPVHKVMDRLLVHPSFERWHDFEVPVGKNYQQGGIPVASQIGESMEFAGLRDWREGDGPRNVHWPSYARSGRLVVREYQQEHYSRVALIVDLELTRYADLAVFEKSLSTVASIVDVLARQEHILDLFAAGNSVYHFQAGRGLGHVDNILDVLASLKPDPPLDVDTLAASLIPISQSLSAVIMIVTTWNETRATLIRSLKSSGITVRVICPRPNTIISDLDPSEVISL